MATESKADTGFVPSERTEGGGREIAWTRDLSIVFGMSVHEEKQETESQEEEEEEWRLRGTAVGLVAA